MTYISPPNRDIAMQLHILPFQLPEGKELTSITDWLKLLDILPRRKKKTHLARLLLCEHCPPKKEKTTFYKHKK